MQIDKRSTLGPIICLTLAWAAASTSWPVRGRGQPNSGGTRELRTLLTTPATFRVSAAPRLDALLQFGQQEKLPLGIECVEAPEMTAPITLSTDPEPVAKILAALLPRRGDYSWRADSPAIDVSCRAARTTRGNLFNLVVARFSLQKSNLSLAGHYLDMAVYWQLHPGAGVAGDFSPGRSKDLIGPMTMRDVTVRDALNRIVSSGPKGAWVARVPPRYLDQVPSGGLWEVAAYDEPFFNATGLGIRQGLAPYEPQRPEPRDPRRSRSR